jgi:RimJ/RimL family protein N-acetyltransferase
MSTPSSSSATHLTGPQQSGGRGVRRLTGPAIAHVLERPTRYAGFASFECGDASSAAVREVQDTARRLYEGKLRLTQVPIVVEDVTGALIGFCSMHRRSHPYPGSPWIAERYIIAFGRDVRYRGYALRDGSTRIGEVLVRAGLDMIAGEAEGGPMPSVSALVRPENHVSRHVLEALGFDWRPATDTGYEQDLLWREAGMALPPLPGSDVYVPPIARASAPGRNDPCPCQSGKKYKHCCSRWPRGRRGIPGASSPLAG